MIQNINEITVDDLENMLNDIDSFKEENELDNLDLKNAINDIDTSQNLFFESGKINTDYIDSEFTDIVHKIINYRNWINEEDIEDTWFEERQIKNFKKIVKNIVSKKLFCRTH